MREKRVFASTQAERDTHAHGVAVSAVLIPDCRLHRCAPPPARLGNDTPTHRYLHALCCPCIDRALQSRAQASLPVRRGWTLQGKLQGESRGRAHSDIHKFTSPEAYAHAGAAVPSEAQPQRNAANPLLQPPPQHPGDCQSLWPSPQPVCLPLRARACSESACRVRSPRAATTFLVRDREVARPQQMQPLHSLAQMSQLQVAVTR